MGNNVLQAIDLLIAVTNTSLRLQELLQRAAAEGRDITDEELRELRTASTEAAAALLKRLADG